MQSATQLANNPFPSLGQLSGYSLQLAVGTMKFTNDHISGLNPLHDLSSIRRIRILYGLIETKAQQEEKSDEAKKSYDQTKNLYHACLSVWLTSAFNTLAKAPNYDSLPEKSLDLIEEVAQEFYVLQKDVGNYLQWGAILQKISAHYLMKGNFEKVFSCVKLGLNLYDAITPDLAQLPPPDICNYGIGLSYILHACYMTSKKQDHLHYIDKAILLLDALNNSGLQVTLDNQSENISYWVIKMLIDSIFYMYYTPEETQSFITSRINIILTKCYNLQPVLYDFIMQNAEHKNLNSITEPKKSVPLTDDLLTQLEDKPPVMAMPVLQAAPIQSQLTPFQRQTEQLLGILEQCGTQYPDGSIRFDRHTVYTKFFKSPPRVSNLPKEIYLTADEFAELKSSTNMKFLLGKMIETKYAIPKPSNPVQKNAIKVKKPAALKPSTTKPQKRRFSWTQKSASSPDATPVALTTLTRSHSSQMAVVSPASGTSSTTTPKTAPVYNNKNLAFFVNSLPVPVRNPFAYLAEDEDEVDVEEKDILLAAPNPDAPQEEIKQEEARQEISPTPDLTTSTEPTEAEIPQAEADSCETVCKPEIHLTVEINAEDSESSAEEIAEVEEEPEVQSMAPAQVIVSDPAIMLSTDTEEQKVEVESPQTQEQVEPFKSTLNPNAAPYRTSTPQFEDEEIDLLLKECFSQVTVTGSPKPPSVFDRLQSSLMLSNFSMFSDDPFPARKRDEVNQTGQVPQAYRFQ